MGPQRQYRQTQENRDRHIRPTAMKLRGLLGWQYRADKRQPGNAQIHVGSVGHGLIESCKDPERSFWRILRKATILNQGLSSNHCHFLHHPLWWRQCSSIDKRCDTRLTVTTRVNEKDGTGRRQTATVGSTTVVKASSGTRVERCPRTTNKLKG